MTAWQRVWERGRHWGGPSRERGHTLFSESEVLGLSLASVVFRLYDVGQVTWCLWISVERQLFLLSWRTTSRVRLVWLVRWRAPTTGKAFLFPGLFMTSWLELMEEDPRESLTPGSELQQGLWRGRCWLGRPRAPADPPSPVTWPTCPWHQLLSESVDVLVSCTWWARGATKICCSVGFKQINRELWWWVWKHVSVFIFNH